MKKFYVAAWLVVFSAHAFSQYAVIDSSRLPQTFPHYLDELAFDKPSNEQAWTNVSAGLHASFGSPDQLYFRREVPEENMSDVINITGWKGERLNAQVIVWSPDTTKQVRLKLNDLVNENGNKIAAANITTNLVRYVLANYPYGSRDATCGSSPYNNGYLMPDRFEFFERFELPGKSARPVWISINVPPDA